MEQPLKASRITTSPSQDSSHFLWHSTYDAPLKFLSQSLVVWRHHQPWRNLNLPTNINNSLRSSLTTNSLISSRLSMFVAAVNQNRTVFFARLENEFEAFLFLITDFSFIFVISFVIPDLWISCFRFLFSFVIPNLWSILFHYFVCNST